MATGRAFFMQGGTQESCMRKEQIPIALEGYPFIFVSSLLTLSCALLGSSSLTLLFFLVTVFVVYFFRDPVRIRPEQENAVISPADGKVIFAGETVDERFHAEKVQKISIFMNVFNFHVNRIPFAGTVEHITFKPGKFYAADKDKACLHNEYCAMRIRSKTGNSFTVVQIAGLIARRIVCRAEIGDQVETGQRYGLIRFGSRVDLYLPLDARLTVSNGQKVRCGESVLAQFS